MSENTVLPGDQIASIEEYEAGYNTFDDGDMVRAAACGRKKHRQNKPYCKHQTSKSFVHSKSR